MYFACSALAARRLECSEQQGAKMCWEGKHLNRSGGEDEGEVGAVGGGRHCSQGAFVSDAVSL